MAPTQNDQDAEGVEELADACVLYVKEALQLELDYTPETLPILDHYLKSRIEDSEQELLNLLAPTAGAYFGEVVRKHLGGARWHCPSGHFAAHRIEFETFFLHFNPLGVALEVLTSSDAAGWHAHFSVLDEAREPVAASLEATSEVRLEDYYSFAVRYETLEQITGVLSALQGDSAAPARHFGRDVYLAMSGERDTDPN
jgi:hypothetical protein